MALFNEFKPESTPILYYAPKPHVDTRPGGRRYLLVPVYAYKVLAPRPTERRLNIFQKAVLGFCRSGQNEPDTISGRLHLDREVIRFVLSELRHSGYINQDNRLTTLGEQILTLELDRLPDEIVPAYVFQDPWYGKLWPRIVPKLEFAQIDFENENRYPILLLGTKGSPKRFSPYVKRTDANILPRTPTPSEILRASRRHERDNRLGSSSVDEEEIQEIEGDDSFTFSQVDSPNLREIFLVSEEPELFYMTTMVYIPNYELHKVEWYVSDPFGLGASPWLRKWIDQQVNLDSNLRNYIERFINECLGDGFDTQKKEEDHFALEMIASEIINQRLGGKIDQTKILDLLSAMERTYQETLLYAGSPPKDKLEDVMIKAGKVIEALFRVLNQNYQRKDAWKIYNIPERQSRFEILNEIAKNLGFTTPIPYSLSGISPTEIRRALESGGGTLGERVVATILIAHYETGHPIRKIANTTPELFSRIATLMRLRGMSAHDTDLEISPELVLEQRENTYQIIALILNLRSDSTGGSHG